MTHYHKVSKLRCVSPYSNKQDHQLATSVRLTKIRTKTLGVETSPEGYCKLANEPRFLSEAVKV